MNKLHQLFKHKKFPKMLLFYLMCPIKIYLYLQPDFSYRIKIQQNSILPKVLCN